MEKIIIKNRVKLARIEADMTQQQLADQIGVTRQTIGLIEAQNEVVFEFLGTEYYFISEKDWDAYFATLS